MNKSEYKGYDPQGKKIVLISKDKEKNKYWARSSRNTSVMSIEGKYLGEYLVEMLNQGFTILQ